MQKNRSHVGVAEQWNQKYIFTKIHTELHTITYTICPSHFLSHTGCLAVTERSDTGTPPNLSCLGIPLGHVLFVCMHVFALVFCIYV